MDRYEQFQRIAEVEFRTIISGTDNFGHKLRIYFIDKSFLDVFVSTQCKFQLFSFHWERRHLEKGFFRLDNTPDPKWKKISSFPIHFHRRSYDNVVNSPFSKNDNIEDLFREFMKLIQEKTGNKEG